MKRMLAVLAAVFLTFLALFALSEGTEDLSLLSCEGAAPSPAASLPAAGAADQIVLVEYRGGSNAAVSFHEKTEEGWVKLYETFGYVGKNGMGKTRAGDKRTPVGVYDLTTPFGILDDPGSSMPYTKLTKYHYWCGSSSSGYYNQFCDSRVNGRACASSDEHLIDYKGFYDYCMFIDYNREGVPGLGSCIFLHCIGTRTSTAGCVAIPREVMREVIIWARPGVKIVLGDPISGGTAGEGTRSAVITGEAVNLRVARGRIRRSWGSCIGATSRSIWRSRRRMSAEERGTGSALRGPWAGYPRAMPSSGRAARRSSGLRSLSRFFWTLTRSVPAFGGR